MATTNIQTIGAGRNHATLAAFATWLANRDLVANDEIVEAHVYDNVVDPNMYVYPKTYSATNYCIIRPAPGLGVNDLEATGPLTYGTQGIEIRRSAGSNGFRFGHGVSLQGFRIDVYGTGIYVALWLARINATDAQGLFDVEFKYNRVKITMTGANSKCISTNNNNSGARITDNVFFVTGSAGIVAELRDYLSFQRNTIIQSGTALGRTAVTCAGSVQTLYFDNVFVGCGATPMNRGSFTFTQIGGNFSDTAITGTSTGFTVATPLVVSDTDALPAAASALLGAATSNANNTYDIRGGFRGMNPDSGVAMLVAADQPGLPNATISGTTVYGQRVTVTGTLSEYAISGTVTINPAATANGAVAKTVSATLSGTGVEFTAVLENVQPGNYLAPVGTFNNMSGTGSSASGAAFAVAVPVAPTIKILGVVKSGNNITVSGDYTGIPVSASLTIPAAAVPNGASTVGPVAIQLQSNGTFSVSVSGVAYGSYDGPQVSATNYSGTDTDTGSPFTLYAPGTQPQGLPAVELKPYVAPAFTTPSVAMGAKVTDVTFENTSATAQTNVPFTFGQPFKQGELMPADKLIGKISGQADVPLQFNVKATHFDGSIRHAAISGVLPTLAGSGSVMMSLHRQETSTVTDVAGAATAPAAAGMSAVVTVVAGGTTYTASVTDALAAGVPAAKVWLAGSVVTERVVMIPLKTAAGVEHPQLTVQFSLRFYPGINKAKVDVAVENSKAYSAQANVLCDVSVAVAGAVVYAKSGLTHYAACRWKKTFWWNNASPVHIRHNTPYLIATKAVPNYDSRIIMSDDTLNKWATALGNGNFEPMKAGIFQPDMAATGGRGEIGLSPDTYAAAVISMDKRAKDIMLASADIAGSWGCHRRDGSGGPAAGLPMDIVHWPYATIGGTPGDAANPATGINEKLPALPTGNPNLAETAHQPAFGYIPYLLTADFFYLEVMHFFSNFTLYSYNPGSAYRDYTKGYGWRNQVRGQAWQMRGLAQAAAFTPDDHLSKAAFIYWVNNNLEYYNTNYTDNPSANQLRVITDAAMVYTMDSAPSTGIAPWQDDFFAQATGHAWELGFEEAGRLLQWKSKFQVDRFLAPGYCWIQASIYSLRVRDSATSPLYTSIAEALARSHSPTGPQSVTLAGMAATHCGTQEYLDQLNADRALPSEPYVMNQMVGYSYGNTGFPSNLQPALAMAADSGYPDADLAWDLFDSRAVLPNYQDGPQFAVVPRTIESAPPPPPGPPGPPTGVSATAFNGMATVSFNPPASNGGSTISMYSVRNVQTGIVATGTSSPIQIAAQNSVPQTFVVAATNSYGTGVESQPSAAVTPNPAVTATITLTEGANRTGLKWAWFDSTLLSNLSAPTDKGSDGSTNSSGVMTITLPNTTKKPGEVGWLVVTDSDGTVQMSHRAFSGPVTVG